jgi:hypothetical protein
MQLLSHSHALSAHTGTRAPRPDVNSRLERLLARHEPIDPLFAASARDRRIKAVRGAERGRARSAYRPI